MSQERARSVRVTTLILAVALSAGGAWLGVLVAGRASYTLGPFTVELYARPGSGLTEVALPPLGEVRADTHQAPIRLTAKLERVDPDQLNQTVAAEGLDGLVERVERTGLDAIRTHAIRTALIALAGVLMVALIFRAQAGLARIGLTGLAVVSLMVSWTWLGYRPEAFAEPAYTGSLRLAPGLVGPIRQATHRLELFRQELGQLVRSTAEAFGAVTAGAGPSEDALVVLHISDVHASPLGMDFAQRLAVTFRADLVVDTGDVTSFSSRLERSILDRIPQFRVPYVFVRGNHDSLEIGVQAEAQPNGVTLESESTTAAGLTLFGAAHPLFTPGRRFTDVEIAEALEAAGRGLDERIAALDRPPDIVLVHDDRMASDLAGDVPLVLSGHFHHFDDDIRGGTLFLETASTGGGGLDTFVLDESVPLAAEILYLEGSPPRLVAVDRVALEPETRQLVVDRRLAATIRQEAGEPVPAPTSPAIGAAGERRPLPPPLT